MPANLENSAVATGLEKVSFHSNPKERKGKKVKMKSLSHVQIFATPGIVAYQAPTSMGFSRQEYTGELHKKDLYDPDNHKGVITHLEPDILECEVKRALESISR